jgi:D-3-phosphoglycerate dehydrogenase
VLLSPHAAGLTPEATGRLLTATLDNLEAVLDGREPANVINGIPGIIRRKFHGSPTV